MHKARNTLLSLAATIATTKLVQLVSSLDLDDVLRPVGLSRRQRRWPGNLAFLTAGVVVGATGALLLAPATGEEARARVAKKAGELKQSALKKAREVGEELRQELLATSIARGNGDASSAVETT
jgi:hypothetical protein